MESREAIENHIIFKTIVKWLEIGFSWFPQKSFEKLKSSEMLQSGVTLLM